MDVQTTEIEGVLLLRPRVFEDERGFFFESYNEQRFREHGINIAWVQDNHAMSRPRHPARPPLPARPAPAQARALLRRPHLGRRRRYPPRLPHPRPLVRRRTQRRQPRHAPHPRRLRPRLLCPQRPRRVPLQMRHPLRPRPRKTRSPGTTPTSPSTGRSISPCCRKETSERRASETTCETNRATPDQSAATTPTATCLNPMLIRICGWMPSAEGREGNLDDDLLGLRPPPCSPEAAGGARPADRGS